MSLSVSLAGRDFADLVSAPDVQFAVRRYSHAAIGGPDQAEVLASGPEYALWTLFNLLRAPVTIRDGRSEPVWWGYLAGVTVQSQALEIGVSLQQMFNRVAVAYSYVPPGSNTVGQRVTTAWVQDDDSVSMYGSRELRHSRGGTTASGAAARRDALLEQYRWPTPAVSVTGGKGTLTASLHCRGWWDTLDWQYYTRTAGQEAHTAGTATQALGNVTAHTRIWQSFQIAGGDSWEAHSVAVKVRKEATPADTLYVDVCADSTGTPGAVLARASSVGSAVGATLDWLTLELDAPVLLTASTPYWLVLHRSGALDATNYYVVTVDEGLGYARGVLRLYDGSSGAARSPDADLAFKVLGVEETTTQIEKAVTAKGQFLQGVDIIHVSDVRSSQYRTGDETAQQVIAGLLADGTTSGRRLLGYVTPERYLRVYEEPTPTEANLTLYVSADGRPQDLWGNYLLAHTCPVRRWCVIKDVIPATVNMTALAAPSPFFVEWAEYDAEQRVWTPRARGLPTPWQIGEMQDG